MSQIEKRTRIRVLLEGKKHTPEEISYLIGVSLATVYNVKSRIQANISIKHLKGGGRPSKLAPIIGNSIAQQIRRTPSISLRALASKCPVEVSKNTVARCLEKLNYTKPYPTPVPMLSEKNRLKRVEWAYANIRNFWQNAIFADEASIWINRGRVRMWTKNGNIRTAPTVKHTQKIHIWAGFSSAGTFTLCIFTENLTARIFCDIINGHLLEQARVLHGEKWFLVQDNDPKHTAKITKAWLEQNVPQNTIDWPSQSPDVNPIENLFAWLEQELIKDVLSL